MHRFDVKTIKTSKTTQNYKRDQITMNLHRFDVNTIKNVEYVAKYSKQRKTKNVIKLQWFHRFDVKNIKTTQNYKRDQIRTIYIDLTSKRSKHRKTKKATKLQWIASIGRRNNKKCWVTSQNIQTNAKLQNWSNYNYLHQF